MNNRIGTRSVRGTGSSGYVQHSFASHDPSQASRPGRSREERTSGNPIHLLLNKNVNKDDRNNGGTQFKRKSTIVNTNNNTQPHNPRSDPNDSRYSWKYDPAMRHKTSAELEKMLANHLHLRKRLLDKKLHQFEQNILQVNSLISEDDLQSRLEHERKRCNMEYLKWESDQKDFIITQRITEEARQQRYLDRQNGYNNKNASRPQKTEDEVFRSMGGRQRDRRYDTNDQVDRDHADDDDGTQKRRGSQTVNRLLRRYDDADNDDHSDNKSRNTKNYKNDINSSDDSSYPPPPRRGRPQRSRSPPPRRRNDSRSPPPRRRNDSRSPPPRRRSNHNSDDSRSPPPRRRNFRRDSSSEDSRSRSRSDSDSSLSRSPPPRNNYSDSDSISPRPRNRRNDDDSRSPPRRQHTRNHYSDSSRSRSPPPPRNRHDDNSDDSHSPPPPRNRHDYRPSSPNKSNRSDDSRSRSPKSTRGRSSLPARESDDRDDDSDYNSSKRSRSYSPSPLPQRPTVLAESNNNTTATETKPIPAPSTTNPSILTTSPVIPSISTISQPVNPISSAPTEESHYMHDMMEMDDRF